MGAMENWGLTTYREVALLYNSKTTSAAGMQRIAYIVGHELAHQWFGNIVTMKWWSDLWLNEGFATWAGWLVVHEFFPSWNVWDQFQTSSYESALKLDALVSSHPIEVDVNKAREIDDIFDAISYCKGASAIRMLVAHMGEAVFQAGIKEYVKAHAYGNASTLDLWSQLARSSGKDISAYMDTWTKKTGYPLVTVSAAAGTGTYTVRQQRFLADPNLAADTSVVWPVPLRLAYLGPGDKVTVEEVLMTTLEHTFTLPEGAVAVKVNFGQYGFFRTLYSEEALSALISYGVHKLPVADR
jgi:aminopeptidase 2